jgi:hypothetical protein
MRVYLKNGQVIKRVPQSVVNDLVEMKISGDHNLLVSRKALQAKKVRDVVMMFDIDEIIAIR